MTTSTTSTTSTNATAAAYSGYFHEAHEAMRAVVGGLGPALLDWKPGDQTNSIAVLVAHALDSERHGTAVVVGITMPRDRDAAFAARGLTADELVKMIDSTERDVDGYLARLTDQDLVAPLVRFGRTASGARWLLHAAVHDQEHIGQAYLTRQLAERAEATRKTA
jgi:uncharacterized damage-inducible protein DinB